MLEPEEPVVFSQQSPCHGDAQLPAVDKPLSQHRAGAERTESRQAPQVLP